MSTADERNPPTAGVEGPVTLRTDRDHPGGLPFRGHPPAPLVRGACRGRGRGRRAPCSRPGFRPPSIVPGSAGGPPPSDSPPSRRSLDNISLGGARLVLADPPPVPSDRLALHGNPRPDRVRPGQGARGQAHTRGRFRHPARVRRPLLTEPLPGGRLRPRRAEVERELIVASPRASIAGHTLPVDCCVRVRRS